MKYLAGTLVSVGSSDAFTIGSSRGCAPATLRGDSGELSTGEASLATADGLVVEVRLNRQTSRVPWKRESWKRAMAAVHAACVL